ncbi:hypothetical protein MMC31_004076 [Peltigera leucophlebia]|nr:hypothetical protein [Peltigera leucophlebia]
MRVNGTDGGAGGAGGADVVLVDLVDRQKLQKSKVRNVEFTEEPSFRDPTVLNLVGDTNPSSYILIIRQDPYADALSTGSSSGKHPLDLLPTSGFPL